MTTPSANEMQARLWQATEDLRAWRISPAESRKITKEVTDELRVVESALRLAKVTRRLSGP